MMVAVVSPEFNGARGAKHFFTPGLFMLPPGPCDTHTHFARRQIANWIAENDCETNGTWDGHVNPRVLDASVPQAASNFYTRPVHGAGVCYVLCAAQITKPERRDTSKRFRLLKLLKGNAGERRGSTGTTPRPAQQFQ